MKIDRLDAINHIKQSAITSPGQLLLARPPLPWYFVVALCNGSHNTTLNLRSRSPLAHFELLYIYNRQTGRLHIPKGDLDQYGQIFIPNDCTFGLFRLYSCSAGGAAARSHAAMHAAASMHRAAAAPRSAR